jgi:hypothetical protein
LAPEENFVVRALVFLATLQSLATTAFAVACALSETLMMNWPLVFGLILSDVCFMAYIAAERSEEAAR